MTSPSVSPPVFVADAMRHGIFVCLQSATLRDVARIMAERGIHCVAVSRGDDAGLPWGIVSDMDLVRAHGADLDAVTAGEAAATEVITIGPSATVEEAAHVMAEHGAAHLVVVATRGGRPLGIISSLDIAAARAASAPAARR